MAAYDPTTGVEANVDNRFDNTVGPFAGIVVGTEGLNTLVSGPWSAFWPLRVRLRPDQPQRLSCLATAAHSGYSDRFIRQGFRQGS